MLLLAILMAVSAAVAATAPPAASGDAFSGLPPATSFATNPLWDDGQAEINTFAAVEVRYGQARPASVVLIVVKEDLLPGSWVKADTPGPSSVPALKLNRILDIPTGVYSYQQMVSVFMSRQDLALRKITLSSHEWCGNTWKGLVASDASAVLEYRTYWEGQAAGHQVLEWSTNMVSLDALPVRLRALPLARAATFGVTLLPTLIGTRADPLLPAPATVSVAPGFAAPGFEEVAAARITLISANGEDRFWIETHFPHRLLGWTRADGASYRLQRSRRLPYWKLNRPGDEGVLDAGESFDPPMHQMPDGDRP